MQRFKMYISVVTIILLMPLWIPFAVYEIFKGVIKRLRDK